MSFKTVSALNMTQKLQIYFTQEETNQPTPEQMEVSLFVALDIKNIPKSFPVVFFFKKKILKRCTTAFHHQMAKISGILFPEGMQLASFFPPARLLIYDKRTKYIFYSPSAGKAKIRSAHRKIMILNHPDKGMFCVG